MIGRTLGGATVALLQGLIVLIVTILLGFRPDILTLPLGFVFMLLISLFFTAFGTAVASFLKDMQGFQMIMITAAILAIGSYLFSKIQV